MSILKRFAGMAHSDARLKGRIDALTAETESLRAQMEGLGDQLKRASQEIAREKQRLEAAQGVERTMLRSNVDSLEIRRKTLAAQYSRLGDAIAIRTRDLQLAQQELFRREHPGMTEEDVQSYVQRMNREIVLNEYERSASEQFSSAYEEFQRALYPDAEEDEPECIAPEDSASAEAIVPPETRFYCAMPDRLVSRALPMRAEDETIAEQA